MATAYEYETNVFVVAYERVSGGKYRTTYLVFLNGVQLL